MLLHDLIGLSGLLFPLLAVATKGSTGCNSVHPPLVIPGEPSQAIRFLTAHGGKRSFNLHIPAAYQAKEPVPLILAFHGKNQAPTTFENETQLSNPAFNDEAIVAFPQGVKVGAIRRFTSKHDTDTVAGAVDRRPSRTTTFPSKRPPLHLRPPRLPPSHPLHRPRPHLRLRLLQRRRSRRSPRLQRQPRSSYRRLRRHLSSCVPGQGTQGTIVQPLPIQGESGAIPDVPRHQ